MWLFIDSLTNAFIYFSGKLREKNGHFVQVTLLHSYDKVLQDIPLVQLLYKPHNQDFLYLLTNKVFQNVFHLNYQNPIL